MEIKAGSKNLDKIREMLKSKILYFDTFRI